MNTDTDKTPDYGEPWSKATEGNGFAVYARNDTVYGIIEHTSFDVRYANRIVQCVNACAGMADPAAELAAMREAVAVTQALAEWSARYPRGFIYSASNCQMDAELIELEERAKAATAKLQPFIK